MGCSTRSFWTVATIATLAGVALANPAQAGDADVTAVAVRQAGSGVYDFDVTVRSADTGWERYADRLEVLRADGTVLGTRVLDHPHEAEQPFTRDLYGVRIPAGIGTVQVRAHFKPTGFGSRAATVTIQP